MDAVNEKVQRQKCSELRKYVKKKEEIAIPTDSGLGVRLKNKSSKMIR